jgi:hypothetical protein
MSEWPKWFYHADEPEGRLFYSQQDVPAGWVTGPHLMGPAETEPVKATPLPSWGEEDLDAPPQTEIKRSPGRPRKQG